MYIVNTTFIVESSDQAPWLVVMRNSYIPFIKEAGFDDITFTRIISMDPTREFTYSLQVGIMDRYRRFFTEEIAVEYSRITAPIFGDRVVWFTSLMKRIELE